VRDTDDMCQECERPWIYGIETGEYVDRFYCRGHALEWIVESNSDQRDYDLASAMAALDSMITEGTVIEA
jgi:hypothetical protein